MKYNNKNYCNGENLHGVARYIRGTYVVHTWYICGTYVVHTWYIRGTCMVHVWYTLSSTFFYHRVKAKGSVNPEVARTFEMLGRVSERYLIYYVHVETGLLNVLA